MSFIIILMVTCLFVPVAAKSIRTVPRLWYGLALAIDVLYVYGIVFSLPPMILQVLSAVVQRGMLGTSLFIIVMYCGVFPERSYVRKTVGPIRAELSIIACILVFAHSLNYLNSYLGVLLFGIGAVSINQLASLLIAIVLFALMLVLGATSLKSLRCRIKTGVWKNIQRTSYVFFALIYIHEVLILYPPALKGSGEALPTLMVSTMVFFAYFVLRVVRYFIDRRERNSRMNVDLNAKEAKGA